MYRYLFIFILLIAIPLAQFAQTETLLTQGIEKTLEVKYSQKAKNGNNNQILEFVAKAKALPVNATTLVYNVKEHQKIIKTSSKLQLQLSVGNFVFPDKVDYLKFSINRFLTPGFISYTYIFADGDGKVLETKTVSDQKFKNGSYLLNKKIENTFNTASFKLYLSDVGFGFTVNNVAKLNEFMSIVDAYYNADARLNLLEQELDKIRTDTIEMLEAYRQITIDNIKAFNQIRSQRFTSKLALNANDPIQFKSHFGRVEVRNKQIKKELEKTIDNMHVTYYLKGKDWLKWGDKQKAAGYFQKSIAEKGNYPPPFYELAKFDYENKLYSKVIDTCSMILNTLKPDSDTRYATVKLAESVIYVYIDDINSSIGKGDFTSALNKLTLCEGYSKNIPGVKYFSEFDEIHGKLFIAYYTDMVNTAQQQIDSKQLQAAQLSVDSLAQFRAVHSNYILTAEKEYALLNDLYGAWVDAGKIYTEKNIADSSLYAFTQAYILCHKYEPVVCSGELTELIQQARINQYNFMISRVNNLINEQWADSALNLLNEAEIFRAQNNLETNPQVAELNKKARQLKYSELITEGQSAYNENKSREALAFYDEALAIEKDYDIVADTTLTGKISMAAQNYILLLCIQGETLIEALHINDAKQKLNAAENIYNYYSLADTVSTTAILNLKDKLKTGRCEQVSYLYNIQIIAARKFIEQKEFIFAWDALGKAKTINKNDKGCNLSDSAYRRLSNEISAMLHYQKKTIEINEQLENKEYANTIDDYIVLTKFFADSCQNSFGIQHKDLYPYIFYNKNLGLIDFGVRYYLDLGKIDTALLLLDELYSRGYISSWSKVSQVALGTQLALKDIEADAEIDPKLKVLDYSKANKWYNHLKKAYLQQWKNL